MFSNEHHSLGQEEHSSYHVATAIASPMLGCMMHPKGKEFGMVGAAATAVENGWNRFQTTVEVCPEMGWEFPEGGALAPF